MLLSQLNNSERMQTKTMTGLYRDQSDSEVAVRFNDEDVAP